MAISTVYVPMTASHMLITEYSFTIKSAIMKTVQEGKGLYNPYQEVTDRIIDLLEDQQLKWDKPWISLSADGKPAHNAFSGRPYSGINQILLTIRRIEAGYTYNGWMTFNQVIKNNGSVLSGEKSSRIFFHKIFYTDKDGNQLKSDQLRDLSANEKERLSKKVYLKYYKVFNIAQTSGLDDSLYQLSDQLQELSEFEKDDRADALIKSTAANVIHEPSNRAYYNILEDIIYLPEKAQFKGRTAYYATVLHELAHWTGHESRLNRQIQSEFGSQEYAKEELVAELCSAFVSTDLGFTKSITNNAAYIQDWITVLKNDNRYIFKAVRDTEMAANFVKQNSQWRQDGQSITSSIKSCI